MCINKGIKLNIFRIISIFLICSILIITLSLQAKAYTVEPQYFNGSLSSSSDVYTTDVTIDYALTTTYHLFLIRTGTSGFTVNVLDSSGNTLKTANMSSKNAQNPTGIYWTSIPNPNSETGQVTYTLQVTASSYDTDCSFNIAVGSYDDAELLLSGKDNSVPLARYVYMNGTSVYDNYYSTTLVPNQDAQWFSFVATSSTTINIKSLYQGLRFRIEDASETIYYDSNNDSTAHKTYQPLSTVYYVERAKPSNLIAGQTYYCAVYMADAYKQSVSTPIITTSAIQIAIGGPRLVTASSSAFYSPTSVTGTSTSYSSNATITVSGLPSSATVYRAYFKASGVQITDLEYWRYRPSSTSVWSIVGPFVFNQAVAYTYEGSSNKLANGTWYVGIKASSSKGSLTCKPGLQFDYYYQMGD